MSAKRELTVSTSSFGRINNKSVDFYKIEHRPYMGEGEGSILGTFELKQIAKNRHFVFLCDNSAHKRAGEQKI